jgi:hypothetical protein
MDNKRARMRLGISLQESDAAKSLWCGAVLLAVSLILVIARPVMAVRPFITDDARVLEEDQAQLETSLRIDRFKFQNLNLIAYGTTNGLEATVGFVDGYYRKDPVGLSISGPLLQLKYLLMASKPMSYPGVAVAIGCNPPYGTGGLKPDVWSEFAYLALTETIVGNEGWLWHGNIGVSVNNTSHYAKGTLIWGIGTQIKFWKGLCPIGEIVSGDPYSSNQTSGGAFQAGFRYIFSDNLQADVTIGSGLWGNPRPGTWGGLGLRMVFDSLLNRKKESK